MREKSALVTGGAGFIGSHLVDYLLKQGWYIKVIDNLSAGTLANLKHHKGNPNLRIRVGDLKDPKTTFEVVKDIKTVFHFAANPEVRLSTTNPKTHFDENILATFNLLEAVRQRGGIKYIMFASSSSVYGEPTDNPVKENYSTNPASVYGATKISCEHLISTYARLYGFKSVALRYANVVGPRLGHGVVYDFVKKLQQNHSELEILGDGHQIRSYLYIDDAIKAAMTALMVTKRDSDAYNVGNKDWITVSRVADIIIETMGLNNVKYVYKPLLHGIGWLGDVKKIILDISKIRNLGWKPRYTSTDAVLMTARELIRKTENRVGNNHEHPVFK